MKIRNAKGEPGAQETQRRARILERYDAIERPSAADDEAAAAEINMSVGSLLHLVGAWRRHRSETPLVGQAAALKRVGGADREKVMADAVELDLVRPDRRTEILRKIRIIQRYVADTECGWDDAEAAEAAAAEMGVSIGRFRVIARTWTLLARAETLPGATRRGTPWRRKPEHARRQELLRSVLKNARPEAKLRAVYDAFVAACLVEDLKPLSLTRFYGIVNDLRNPRT